MIIVTIGLIKARIQNAKLIVGDLMSGSLKPDKIIFCVSKEPYLLDKGIKPNELPRINNPKVEFKYVENFGPLRRISPIVEEYYDRPETKIIIFDDDRKPAKDTLEKLVAYSDKHPNVAAAAAGNVWGGDKDKYAKLGVIYDHRHGHIDGIVLGWSPRLKQPIEVQVANPGVGLLVKPKFFSEDFFKWKEYYDDSYWGISKTDQTFINYSMAKNGIKRMVIPLNYVREHNDYGVGLVHNGEYLAYKIRQINHWHKIMRENKSNIRVRIVPVNDGWALQKIGKYLIDGIPYATDKDDGKPYDLTYFMHFSFVKPCKSKKVGAYFTHRVNDSFEKKAKEVDFAVCMNERYKKFIENITDTHVIYQPTHLQRFIPKLVLGFSGILRSGRKGNKLLDMVSKLPFVELRMTLGKIGAKAMKIWYRNLDYVLITSTIEGGPLCLTEGLASGKEIITSDVGIVDQFKDSPYVHIYDVNKPETLIVLLKKLYQKKLDISKTVEKYSIENFVDKHKKLFEKLLQKPKPKQQKKKPGFKISYAYYMKDIIQQRGLKFVEESFQSIKDQSDDIMVIDYDMKDKWKLKALCKEYGFRYFNIPKDDRYFFHLAKMINKSIIEAKHPFFARLTPDIVYPSNMTEYVENFYKEHDKNKEILHMRMVRDRVLEEKERRDKNSGDTGDMYFYYRPHLLKMRGVDERGTYYNKQHGYNQAIIHTVLGIKSHLCKDITLIHRDHEYDHTGRWKTPKPKFEYQKRIQLLKADLENEIKNVVNSYW